MSHSLRSVAAFVLVLASVGNSPARSARPAPCEPGRFLVSGSPVAGKAGALQLGSAVSLDALCASVAPKRLKINRKGVTAVLAKWSSCDGLTGTVVLHGKILAGCNAFTGTLKAKKLKTTIHATRSTCGDGVVDQGGGEVCDDGNTTGGDGCEADCKHATGNLPTTTTLSTPTTTTIAAATTTTITAPSSTTSPASTSTTTTTTTSTTVAGVTTTIKPSTTTLSTTTTTSTSSTTSTTTLPKTVLGLAVLANPDPVAPGGYVVYQLTATNRGPANAVQAALRMTLPAGVFTCGTPSDGGQLPTGCGAAKDVVWALGTIVPGSSRTVQLIVQFRGDVVSGTTLTATARLDDAALSPEATAQSNVLAKTASALSLALAEDADPVQIGDELEYVVRFGNTGANALLATQLVLTLPAGVTVVDAGGGGETPGTVTWSLGALVAGQVGERRVLVHVDDLAAGEPFVRLAHAEISSGAESARATLLVQVQASALALVLVADPDPIAAGDLITYEATVTNRGPATSDQPELRLTLPPSTFVCRTPSDGGTAPEGCAAGRDLVWNLDPLAPGTSRTLQAIVQIRADAPSAAALVATARVKDAAGARARTGVVTLVQSAPPLDLVLATDANPVAPDHDLEYVLRYANHGLNALLSTQLVLDLAPGVTVVDAGGGTETSGTVTWSLGALGAAQGDERRVRVHVNDLGAADPLVRRARAAITSGANAAQAFAVTPVTSPILDVTMAAGPDPLAPAGLLTYQMTVANRGAEDAQQVSAFLTLPSGVFVCLTPSDGGTAPAGCALGTDIVWDLGVLAAGTNRTLGLTIQVRADVPTGSVLRTLARVEDVAGSRARTSLATTVQSTTALNVVMTADADPVAVGDDVEYALRFGNRSAGALLGTQLSFVLPTGTSLVDAGGGVASATGVAWALGSLDGAGTGERRVRIHVTDLGADDPLVRTARATIASGSTVARATTITSIGTAVLGLELSAQPDPLAPAGILSYQATVSNRGIDDAVQTDLRLTLPVGVFVCLPASDAGTTPQGCSAGNDVLWHLDTLAPGTSRVVQLAIQVRADVPNGTALWTTARVEDVSGLRTRTALGTSVQTVAPLDLALTTDVDPIPVGEDLVYALRFGNTGAASLLATGLKFVAPPGTTVLDTDGGTLAGDTITWSLGSLASQALGTRTATVHVNDLGTDDPLTRVARAEIASGTVVARASSVTPVEPTSFGLELTATPDPVAPAGLLTYHLSVTNGSAEDAVQVELRLTLPSGVFVCGTLSDGATTPQGCSAGRDVVWSLGTMSPAAVRNVQAVIQIRSDVPRGSVLVTTSRVQDASGERARAALTTGVGS